MFLFAIVNFCGIVSISNPISYPNFKSKHNSNPKSIPMTRVDVCRTGYAYTKVGINDEMAPTQCSSIIGAPRVSN